MKQIIIIVLLVCIFALLFNNYKEKYTNNLIPKIIWLYWDNVNNIPNIVNNSFKTIKNLNKSFEINLVQKNNINKFIKCKNT